MVLPGNPLFFFNNTLMPKTNLKAPPWLNSLVDEVRQQLKLLSECKEDRQPAITQELAELEQKSKGWMQSLGNPELSPAIRAAIEAEFQTAADRLGELKAQLAEIQCQAQSVETGCDTDAVLERLERLEQVLADENPTLANLELSMHIDKIECFSDGLVRMRTCKLGVLGDSAELLAESESQEALNSTGSGQARTIPRRRSRLRTETSDRDTEELKSAAYYAADPHRFACYPEKWFWTDEFRVPEEPRSWAAEHSEEIFLRRQQTGETLEQLAKEFGVTAPTIGAAIRFYLKAHPETKDAGRRPCGGKRPAKFNVTEFATEAYDLLNRGYSKLKLAEKYGCSTTVIERALKYATHLQNEPVPTRRSTLLTRVAKARALHDSGETVETIAFEMNVSTNSIRKYLKLSYASEGQAKPDLRRRRSA